MESEEDEQDESFDMQSGQQEEASGEGSSVEDDGGVNRMPLYSSTPPPKLKLARRSQSRLPADPLERKKTITASRRLSTTVARVRKPVTVSRTIIRTEARDKKSKPATTSSRKRRGDEEKDDDQEDVGEEEGRRSTKRPTMPPPPSPPQAVGAVRKFQQQVYADSEGDEDDCEDLTTAAPKFNTKKFKIADNVYARIRHIVTKDFGYDAWVITRVPPEWEKNGRSFNFNLSVKYLPMLKMAINKQCPD